MCLLERDKYISVSALVVVGRTVPPLSARAPVLVRNEGDKMLNCPNQIYLNLAKYPALILYKNNIYKKIKFVW